MKRLKQLERAGYKVVRCMQTGNVIAYSPKLQSGSIKANSITALHKRIFGY